jgi:phosphoribosyl 1,2-cyclic phosphodiesterase
VPLPHDAPQIAVIAESKRDERVALVTDLGHIPASLKHDLADCETVLLESNHCPEQLAIAPYPPFLKRRIAGERGHLSNEQAAGLIRDLPNVQRLVLMHLSQKANSPRRAKEVAMKALDGRKVELLIAKQDASLVLPALARGTGQLALAF